MPSIDDSQILTATFSEMAVFTEKFVVVHYMVFIISHNECFVFNFIIPDKIE